MLPRDGKERTKGPTCDQGANNDKAVAAGEPKEKASVAVPSAEIAAGRDEKGEDQVDRDRPVAISRVALPGEACKR